MKYDYAVKVNGKWYPPNTDVPGDIKNVNENTNAEEGAEENDQGTSGKPKSRNTNK